jgi:hypothetical protein
MNTNMAERKSRYYVELKKLRGFSPQANYTDRPPLIGEVSANFCG